MRRKTGGQRYAALLTFVAAAATALFIVPAAFANTPVTHAAFTTTDTSIDGTGNCKNGNEAVNCNIYSGKQYVWINGGPVAAGLDPGTYFFAVLVPGGQGGNQDPNDGTDKNLSDTTLAPEATGYVNSSPDGGVTPGDPAPSGDLYTDRTFTVNDDHSVSYSGPHTFDSANNKIRLMPYDDTTNKGGVYILAICSLADANPANGSPGVDPSDCKYDAFKVQTGEPCTSDCGTDVASDLSVTKDAAGAYTTTWKWGVTKSANKTTVRQNGGTVTVTYTINVTHDNGANTGIGVSGAIHVKNPNPTDSVSDVNVTDELSDNTGCAVTGGASDGVLETLPPGVTDFAYTCSLGALPLTALFNTVTVDWPTQFLPTDGTLVGNTSDYTFPTDPTGTGIGFTQTKVDDCVTVTDPNYSGGTPAGTLGTACQNETSPKVFTYSKTFSVDPNGCHSYDNTATITTDTGKVGTDSNKVTVTICPTVNGLTIGYWQNKNGQARITGGTSTASVCNSGTSLRQYAPFQDLSSTATCAQLATYVYNIIKAANSSGSSMNPMLKAQMLATALNVYFGVTNGSEAIDLTKICKMIDGSGGTASCSGTYQNVSAAFGGATHLTVLQILSYAASQSNVGGSVWYGQVKATQELAKNTFDAINNGVALAF